MTLKTATTLLSLALTAGFATAAQTSSTGARLQDPSVVERAVALCTAEVGDAQTCEGMIHSGTQEGFAWLANGAAQTLARNPGYAAEKDPVRRAVMLCNAYVGDMQTCEGTVLSNTQQGNLWLAKAYAESLAGAPVFKAEKDSVRRAVMLCSAHVGDTQTCEGIVLSGIDGTWLETARHR